MIKNIIKLFIELIFLIIIVLFGSLLFAEQSESTPVIHFDQITHTFSAVFEGEQLSHSFKLINQGTADLEILDVKHS